MLTAPCFLEPRARAFRSDKGPALDPTLPTWRNRRRGDALPCVARPTRQTHRWQSPCCCEAVRSHATPVADLRGKGPPARRSARKKAREFLRSGRSLARTWPIALAAVSLSDI